MTPHRVVALAYPGMTAFELSIAIEVFGLRRPEVKAPWWYSIEVCAASPGRLPLVGGVMLDVPRGVEAIDGADTVIVAGWPVRSDVPKPLVEALQRAHARGARLVSICSGAFVLAATGLLDGRRAATHWRYADALAERYPPIVVDRDVLYVDDGRILTSAGSAAGIDLCLHLIRSDHGADVANRVARRLVVPAHRDGGQAQYIERPVAAGDDEGVHRVLAWMTEHLTEPMTVAGLAARAHLSERQFSRRFRDVTGMPPIEWVVASRIDASLPLLEAGSLALDEVASRVGFATPVTYRHHFRRRMRTSPTSYRKAFLAL